MPKKIKICGIQTEKDIHIMNQLKPDFAGFIFYKKSKRFVPYSKAALLTHQLDGNIKSVGVFVNEKVNKVIEAVRTAKLDIVQLHGDEPDAYIDYLKTTLNCKIINVFRVNQQDTSFHEVNADYYLFDTKVKAYGGTGTSFNWDILQNINTKKPILLAGGINTENIKKALQTKADILDISSAVEVNDNKNFELTKHMIETVRGYQG